jgi:hypothetical protein
MEHTKHIIRAMLLLVVAAVLFVCVRHFMIPESFGAYGHYRYDSVAEFTAYSPVHGTTGICADCHDEQGESLSDGKHSSVACETCHAPLSTHVATDVETGGMKKKDKGGDMVVRRSYELCAWCHQRLEARPKEFPQVVIRDHVSEKGEEMAEGVCLECHDVHNPSE